MGDVVQAAEVLLATVGAVLLLSVAWIWLRRRWLSRTGGTFPCSLRRDLSTVGSPWVLGRRPLPRARTPVVPGVRRCRCGRDSRFDRAHVRAGDQRSRLPADGGLLYDDQRILQLDGPSGGVELAMDAGSLTGLLSWLEAAPPGMRYRMSPASPD